MAEEKPLDKMTVKELKEVALGIEEIQGVSAMKKEELLTAIKKARGIPIKVEKQKIATVVELKEKMKILREKRADLREKGDKTGVARLRRRISRLKKRTRRMAHTAS
ncbi:MAG: Rho termination factor N-terminal domain-containing protein [Deltaproteobacteria bacterium]|nr:Rho termination factor N-terminal domain-containing protein [Deltaproteobacteria bacterium]